MTLRIQNEEKTSLSTLSNANLNMFWGGAIAETLAHLGLAYAIISPGSRSAPLAIGFAAQPKIHKIPVLDERSAAFFALGLAKQTQQPVVLVCTSGTAVANYFPAVVEAYLSQIPLLLLTADRPPELRECRSRQTIDQVKLYGSYVQFYKELAMPSQNLEAFSYLRQTLIHTWERLHLPQCGPVHLNIPFNDLLAPCKDSTFQMWLKENPLEDFFKIPSLDQFPSFQLTSNAYKKHLKELRKYKQGLILVGPCHPEDPLNFAKNVNVLSEALGWPVLADGLSSLRNYYSVLPNIVSTYDFLFRNPEWIDSLSPKAILCIESFPTCKVFRQWLKTKPSLPIWILKNSFENNDPLHGNTVHIRSSVEYLAEVWSTFPALPVQEAAYASKWNFLEAQICQAREEKLQNCHDFFEGKISWLLSQYLPAQTSVFVANSMPVRDVDFFWLKNNKAHSIFSSRGANGIDGTLSTAFGIAHNNKPTVLLTGDLAFLHDISGLSLKKYFQGSLTIVLINNNGGGIFELLPISQFEAVFENYFATPPNLDLKKIIEAYGLTYHAPKSWKNFIELIKELPQSGIQVIEMQTDRKKDALFRRQLFDELSTKLLL